MGQAIEINDLDAAIVEAAATADVLKIGDAHFVAKKLAVKLVADFALEREKLCAKRLLEYINSNPHCLDYPEEDLLEYFFIHVNE